MLVVPEAYGSSISRILIFLPMMMKREAETFFFSVHKFSLIEKETQNSGPFRNWRYIRISSLGNAVR